MRDLRDLGLTYEQAAHGVQSAIKYEIEMMQRNVSDHIKHLRTGIDCRAANEQGLANLLIKKGVFTQEEYLEYIRTSMNEELARYQDYMREMYLLPANTEFR